VTVQAKLEPSLVSAKAGDRFQFERLGFFFVDPEDSKDGAPVFNRTVGLKDSWARAVKAAAPDAPAAEKAKPARRREITPKKEKTEISPEAGSLVGKHSISPPEASLLTEDATLRAVFEGALAAGAEATLAAKWVTNEVRALLKDSPGAREVLTGNAIAEIIEAVKAQVLSPTIAKEVLAETARTGESPKAIIEKRGLRQIVDTSALDSAAQATIAENADLVARYRAGNQNLFGALVGAAMKKTGGKANAKALQEALRKALG
jgi:glutaminyl-tRNA synthetase